MKKFLSISLSFILTFALLVFLPAERFDAAAVGFDNSFTIYSYNQGQLFNRDSVSSGGSSTFTLYSGPARMDNSSVNMMFYFGFTPQGAMGNPSHNNFFGQSYRLYFSFQCDVAHPNENGGSAIHGFNPDVIQKSALLVYYQDGSNNVINCDFFIDVPTVTSSFDVYLVTLDISGFDDKQISSFYFVLYFDFYEAFSIDNSYVAANTVNIFLNPVTFNNTTYNLPSYDVPNVNLPSVDEDGIPILDDYTVDGTQIGDTIGIFTSYSPILLMMIIPTGVGVVAYILFGKRS